jgi:hypothetical protein
MTADQYPVTPNEPARDKLFAALAKAQAGIKPAELNSENPHFRSSYADLKAVWDACRAPLAENGLSVIQTFGLVGNAPVLNTILAHSSGQFMTSTIPLYAKEATPQALGSSITYMRRYALAAMVGVAPDDDDGNAATHAGPPATMNRPAPVKQSNSADPGDYVVEFGKFRGQAIRDIDASDAQNYIEFLERSAREKKKPVDGVALKFVQAFEAHQETVGDGGPPEDDFPNFGPPGP